MTLGSKATFHSCVMAGNTNDGLSATDDGTRVMIDQCQSSDNGTGLHAENNAQVRVSNSNITENAFGLRAGTGGSLLSRQALPGELTNTIEDNILNGAFNGTYTAK